jgi:hypothetical protein
MPGPITVFRHGQLFQALETFGIGRVKSVRKATNRLIVDKVSEWYHNQMAMTLRLNSETDALLTEVADDLEISKQQAVAMAVNEYIEKRHQKLVLRRVVAEILERDKELLDRLADA